MRIREGYQRVVVTMPAQLNPADRMLLLANGTALFADQQDGVIITPCTAPASDVDAAERGVMAGQLAAELAEVREELARETSARISAELTAASARTERDTAQTTLRRERSAHQSSVETLTATSRVTTQEWYGRGHDMSQAVRRLAQVYGCEAEFDRAWLRWESPTDEVPDEIVAPEEQPRVLAEFLTRLADAEHPSVQYPVAGEGAVAVADAELRARLGGGDSIRQAVRAALTAVVAQARRSRGHSGRLPWVAVAAGAWCPSCGHERGEHVGTRGEHCESTRTDSGRPCGCNGPDAELPELRPAQVHPGIAEPNR